MKFRQLFLTAALATSAISAYAMLPTAEAEQAQATTQAAPKVDEKINAFLVVRDASGNETLRPLTITDGVSRGDVVEYQGLYTNYDTNRVRKMTVTLGIPEGTELVGSVEPTIVRASIDGSRFVNMPIRTSVNGQAQELPLSYYKALRWTVEDVGIGATAVVKYRVRIK